MESSCVFCKIISSPEPNPNVIFENDQVLILLDIDWAVKGHVLVIWKEHHKNLSDLNPEDASSFSEYVYRCEKQLLEFLDLKRSIILKTGGLVSHFHFHVYPVAEDLDWDSIKKVFDKKIQYQCSEQEKLEFVEKLRKGVRF